MDAQTQSEIVRIEEDLGVDFAQDLPKSGDEDVTEQDINEIFESRRMVNKDDRPFPDIKYVGELKEELLKQHEQEFPSEYLTPKDQKLTRTKLILEHEKHVDREKRGKLKHSILAQEGNDVLKGIAQEVRIKEAANQIQNENKRKIEVLLKAITVLNNYQDEVKKNVEKEMDEEKRKSEETT